MVKGRVVRRPKERLAIPMHDGNSEKEREEREKIARLQRASRDTLVIRRNLALGPQEILVNLANSYNLPGQREKYGFNISEIVALGIPSAIVSEWVSQGELGSLELTGYNSSRVDRAVRAYADSLENQQKTRE